MSAVCPAANPTLPRHVQNTLDPVARNDRTGDQHPRLGRQKGPLKADVPSKLERHMLFRTCVDHCGGDVLGA